jgi:hypothetical protein
VETREEISRALEKLCGRNDTVTPYAQETHFNILTSDKLFNQAEFERTNTVKLANEEA